MENSDEQQAEEDMPKVQEDIVIDKPGVEQMTTIEKPDEFRENQTTSFESTDSELSKNNPFLLYDDKLSTDAMLSTNLYNSSVFKSSSSLPLLSQQDQAQLLQQQQDNALLGLQLAYPSLAGGVTGSGISDDDDVDDIAESEEMIRITKPYFDNPLALINFNADLGEFLDCKRISDAVRMITKDFPELPSKRRVPYISGLQLSDWEKDQLMKKRNRDNASLTRKRQRIYADFLDKAIHQLSGLIGDLDRANGLTVDPAMIGMQGLVNVSSIAQQLPSMPAHNVLGVSGMGGYYGLSNINATTSIPPLRMHHQSSFIPKEISSATLASMIGMSGAGLLNQQIPRGADTARVLQLQGSSQSTPLPIADSAIIAEPVLPAIAPSEERQDSSSSMTLPSYFFTQTPNSYSPSSSQKGNTSNDPDPI